MRKRAAHASTCFRWKTENCNCNRTMKRVGIGIKVCSRDPFALSLTKLSLVRAFRFCYFNYLNRQTRQVCWPQAVVNYFSWVRSLWPKRVEIETNRFTMLECKTDLHTAPKKLSFSAHIAASFPTRFAVLLFYFSFRMSVSFNLSADFMTCGCSFWKISFVLCTIYITWWLIQRLSLVFLQQLLKQQ